MYFLGLAADFDGTIAHDNMVQSGTRDALRDLKKSGRRLILVTGRTLEDLERVFPEYGIFDWLVLENGAVLFHPASRRLRALAPPPNAELVSHLHSLGIPDMAVGHCIIAAWQPEQGRILEAIRQSGLELQITFNKGALMVLPTGVNKASGLRAAAAELGISPGALVGVGDAENDHSFLEICGCSVAVANAVPAIKAEVDLVLGESHGAGVRSLAEAIEKLDADLLPAGRHGLEIGTSSGGKPVSISPHQGHVLVVGPSRAGKSTLVAMLIERMRARGDGFVVLDPEGDYLNADGVTLLDATSPTVDLADVEVLLAARVDTVVVLRGVEQSRRRKFIVEASKAAARARERAGSPAYMIIDEAHQGFGPPGHAGMRAQPCTILVTVSPALLNTDVLRSVGTLCAFGPDAEALLHEYCASLGWKAPTLTQDMQPASGQMLMWRRGFEPVVVQPFRPSQNHTRHAGKYATGDVGPEHSFYFRGPDAAICVPARNLFEFLDKGRKIADADWQYHIANGDVTRWFADVIRDGELAETAENLRRAPLDAKASWHGLRAAIAARYCLPLDVTGEGGAQ